MTTELEVAPAPVVTAEALEQQFNESTWCHLYPYDGPIDLAYCGARVITHESSPFNGSFEVCPACGMRVCVECVATVKEKGHV